MVTKGRDPKISVMASRKKLNSVLAAIKVNDIFINRILVITTIIPGADFPELIPSLPREVGCHHLIYNFNAYRTLFLGGNIAYHEDSQNGVFLAPLIRIAPYIISSKLGQHRIFEFDPEESRGFRKN